MAKKNKKCPEFENHERWLIAFADMMTLLFALFVVLYAIATVELSKAKRVEDSIRQAFGIKDETNEQGKLPNGDSVREKIKKFVKGDTSRQQILERVMRERAVIISADSKTLEQEIAQRLYGTKEFPTTEKEPEDRVVYVEAEPDGIRISLLARKFFPPNSTSLDKDAKVILDGVGAAIKDLGRPIRVEGHTDNIPYNMNGLTNWELSSLRATAVTKYLIEKNKFKPGSIYSAAFGDTKPLAPNDTPENRAMNRRVDIKILYDKPEDYISKDTDNSEETDE